jgi:pilus assembly protein CpaC
MSQMSYQNRSVTGSRALRLCGLALLAVVVAASWGGTDARAQEPEVLSPQTQEKVDALIDQIYGPEIKMEVIRRRSKLIRTKRDVFRSAVADPEIIDIVQFGQRELAVIGKQTGTTSLTLWFDDPDRPVLSYLVTVNRDPGVDQERRAQYGELEIMLNELFPNSKIRLIPLADKLVVKGQARDAEEASQIMAIVRGESLDAQGQVLASGGRLINQGGAANPFPDAGDIPASNIINMLEVPGEQQVLLKVKIAELNRTALRELGANVDLTFLADNGNEFFLSSVLSPGANLVTTGIFENDFIYNAFVQALASNGTMKILAEPNLVTLSGYTASFIAGGEFAVPTVVGVDGAEAATTRFRGFGTQLTFTPTVLDKDRIRLQVAPEFSQINDANSVQGIPGLNTRGAYTTVDLREGQWLAIAGLIQDQQNGTNSRIPWFGDLPIVGAALSSKRMTRDETELIVLVSPELVHSMEPDETPHVLPGTDVTEPDDIDFYLRGHIEGRPCCDHRSTVWSTYHKRVCEAHHKQKCARCRQRLTGHRHDDDFHGPHGFSD